jgi:2-dehydro-3-deoxyphosphooctonate aldolase (KDO 8-P synthase)
VNVKKGQFLAPEDMRPVVDKLRSTGNRRVMVTERGTTFGYHNLVVDMRSLVLMRETGAPVIFDCTHAVQLPGAGGQASGGQREFVFPLARAAAAVGIHGLFLEVHPDPAQARSDGANSLPLADVRAVLELVKQIHELVR